MKSYISLASRLIYNSSSIQHTSGGDSEKYILLENDFKNFILFKGSGIL